MRELILVRHGHPDHMVQGLTGGWTPSHLTTLGTSQAVLTGRRLADMLGGADFEFYSSDQPRAAETAAVIGAELHVTATLTAELREQNLGAANAQPTERAAAMALPPDGRAPVDRIFFPGAESWRGMMERVHRFLDRLAGDREDRAVLVLHSGSGSCALYWWLGLSPDRWPAVQFELDLASITVLTVGDFDGRRVVRLNDVAHLGPLRA